MRIFDISVAIRADMPTWPGDPPFETRTVHSMARGDAANLSWLGMGAHLGTHLDAPAHFLPAGATVDALPLDVLIGRCEVADLSDATVIHAMDLDKLSLPRDTARLLLKTRNSAFWQDGARDFRPDFVGLAPDAAEWLVGNNVRLIGIDYLSVEPYGASGGHPVHTTLLAGGVVVLECADLSAVPAGRYLLVCLPLKIAGLEAAPARAILVEGDLASIPGTPGANPDLLSQLI